MTHSTDPVQLSERFPVVSYEKFWGFYVMFL